MEKISGILRPSYRTARADNSSAQPARPGAPSFGRPMGRVTTNMFEVDDRVSVSPEARNMANADKVDIANDVSDRFLSKTVNDINDEEKLSQKYAQRILSPSVEEGSPE